jgi:acyl carrier protein
MGLDIVELIMEVEETFDITLPDRELFHVRTVGDLYRLVLAKLPPSGPPAYSCASAVAFYAFRRAAVKVLGVGREDVRPAVPMESLVSREHRRRRWKLLGDELGWRLPGLQPPGRISALGLLSFVIAYGAVIALAIHHAVGWDRSIVACFLSILAFPILIIILCCSMTPFATRFSADCVTLRGTVHRVAKMNFGTIGRRLGYERQDVWEILRTLIVEQLGIRPEEVSEDTKLV